VVFFSGSGAVACPSCTFPRTCPRGLLVRPSPGWPPAQPLFRHPLFDLARIVRPYTPRSRSPGGYQRAASSSGACALSRSTCNTRTILPAFLGFVDGREQQHRQHAHTTSRPVLLCSTFPGSGSRRPALPLSAFQLQLVASSYRHVRFTDHHVSRRAARGATPPTPQHLPSPLGPLSGSSRLSCTFSRCEAVFR